MSYSKRKAHFSNNLDTDRVEQHSRKKENYFDYSSSQLEEEQKVLENKFLNILKNSKNPRKSKVRLEYFNRNIWTKLPIPT